MIRVIIESPYAGKTQEEIDGNIEYALRCVTDSLRRDEAPFASHLLYTQPGILDDSIPLERNMGIEAGLLWGEAADVTAVYIDGGITRGMMYGIEAASKVGRLVVFRSIYEKDEGKNK